MLSLILLFFSAIGIGIVLGGLLADWSLKKYPEYWIQWIKEHKKEEN